MPIDQADTRETWFQGRAAQHAHERPTPYSRRRLRAWAVLTMMIFAMASIGCAEGGPHEATEATEVYDAGADEGADLLQDKALLTRDLVGKYERKPVLNDWHKVEITLESNRLWWKNAAGKRWSLTYVNGILKSGTDCPYGVKSISIQQAGSSVASLAFSGETYQKVSVAADELAVFAGAYERSPVQNGWHQVEIQRDSSGLWWKNAAGKRWSLSYISGVLKTGSDCPYGVTTLTVQKAASGAIVSLGFRGETFTKLGGGSPVDPRTCAQGCSAPTPICGPDAKCTATRWVEPISTLPAKWKAKLNTSVWTKWVRSVIPVVGQAATQDAALLEVAYFAERVHMPQGQILVPDLINSMVGANPTRFSVYPACPNAWIHPAVQPPQSSGGGGRDDTLVTEDWVLRYPKCTGANAVACNQMKPGVLCNNCGWANASEPETCRDTLAHEHGHTIDGHRATFLDPNMNTINKQVFPSNSVEGPAWSASAYFMNPSLESGQGRDRGRPMAAQELNYWSVTQKFAASKYPAGFGYVLKTTRCPQMGLTQACPDTLTRTYSVPLDTL